jgi:hypothetical protein
MVAPEPFEGSQETAIMIAISRRMEEIRRDTHCGDSHRQGIGLPLDRLIGGGQLEKHARLA